MSLPEYSSSNDRNELPSYSQSVGQTSTPGFRPADSAVPGIEDVAAHLKLLKAFTRLRVFIQSNGPNAEEIWQCYLTRSVRNFIIFVSALKVKFKISEGFVSYMDELYPPLDVLLVWHTFLLNPRSIVHEFKSVKFLDFVNYPFPLTRVAAFVDDAFWYKPEPKYLLSYKGLIGDFLARINSGEHYNFDPYYDFDPAELIWPVNCPNCFLLLARVPVYQKNGNSGFANGGFQHAIRANSCKCTSATVIDHDGLRYRQLFRDSRPKTNRFICSFDPNISTMLKDPISKIGQDLKDTAFYGISTSRGVTQIKNYQTTHKALELFSKNTLYFFREYLSYNLIHATLPQTDVITIHEDLVGACLRQQRFIVKMEQLNWYSSKFSGLVIDEAILRYERFCSLMKKTGAMCVPTLDIDLVWHTHQLSQASYFKYCQKTVGKLINHNDKFEETKLNDSFENTCKLYKKEFGSDYSICHCYYCLANRRASRSFFRKQDKTSNELVLHSDFGASHISDHSAITVGTSMARQNQQKIARKYRVPTVESMPWYKRENDHRLYAAPFISMGKVDFEGTGFFACRGPGNDAISSCTNGNVSAAGSCGSYQCGSNGDGSTGGGGGDGGSGCGGGGGGD